VLISKVSLLKVWTTEQFPTQLTVECIVVSAIARPKQKIIVIIPNKILSFIFWFLSFKKKKRKKDFFYFWQFFLANFSFHPMLNLDN